MELGSTDLTYEKPAIEELGSVTEITLGATTGAALDADFPRGTPFGNLTFS